METNTNAGAGRLPRLVVPLNLWLQWDGSSDSRDPGEVNEGEVTWARDKVFDDDIEYVHAGEISRSLMGHKSSELWGDNGLIAATMRCVDALDRIEELIVDADCTAEETLSKIRAILWHNSKL